MQKVELMAPAGSYEALQAAINAGCDSIYFGITQLNMRAKSANNFTLEDLKKIAEICHKNGVKAYLTMNTLLYDHDLNLMKMILDAVKESSIDSIIAADIATIQYAREIGVPVHISVQLSVSNVETVKFWSNFAEIIVLARELDMKMVKHICDEIKKQNICGPSGKLMRIEVFAHGAMCVAVSGRCGMSLFTDNSSANRGACKQNCRKKYLIKDADTGKELLVDNQFVMSPADMCTIDFLDKLLATGVSVLKIEGRGRSADYVDTVIRCYREAIDSIEDGTYSREKIENWLEQMKKVYNRGFSDGYYMGKPVRKWSGSDSNLASEEKVFLGVVSNYFQKIKVAEIDLQAYDLQVGDKLLFTGPKTGVARTIVQELRNDNREVVSKISRKNIATIKVEADIRKRDKVYVVRERKISQTCACS